MSYAFFMLISEYYIVFPEGDIQVINERLPFNALVDINGNVLSLPLLSSKMIAFKVASIKTNEKKGLNETYHYLELLSAEELFEYT